MSSNRDWTQIAQSPGFSGETAKDLRLLRGQRMRDEKVPIRVLLRLSFSEDSDHDDIGIWRGLESFSYHISRTCDMMLNYALSSVDGPRRISGSGSWLSICGSGAREPLWTQYLLSWGEWFRTHVFRSRHFVKGELGATHSNKFHDCGLSAVIRDGRDMWFLWCVRMTFFFA
jgi:hypothetical protein